MENMVSRGTDERTLSVHNEHEFLLKMEKAELTSSLAQRVVDSKGNDLAKKVVRLIENGGFEPSTSQKRAREIMGRNMFGVEEAIRHFGVNPGRRELALLAEVPWSEEVITVHKDTHILIAVFSLSVLDVRGIAKKLADPEILFYNQDWYDKQAFAEDRGEIGWQLVRKTPIANSTNKSWNEQQALLKDEETPTARIVVQTVVGHFLATGERLFEKIWVRCSDLDSGGDRVCLGGFDAQGLSVNNYWDGTRYDDIGLSASRKS